ncbi:hypothetical protein [Streptomyces cyaneofuscatus]|uniref:hypothetical protein n=1 Tax=Streptomyces cyaneofuscatus TaxID=66883 RepID=UPI00341E9257
MTYDLNKPRVSRDRARYLDDERRKQTQGALAVVTCVVLIAALPVQAFILMLAMGAVHGAFIAVPAIGYGTSVLFVLGANLVIGFIRRLFRK